MGNDETMNEKVLKVFKALDAEDAILRRSVSDERVGAEGKIPLKDKVSIVKDVLAIIALLLGIYKGREAINVEITKDRVQTYIEVTKRLEEISPRPGAPMPEGRTMEYNYLLDAQKRTYQTMEVKPQ